MIRLAEDPAIVQEMGTEWITEFSKLTSDEEYSADTVLRLESILTDCLCACGVINGEINEIGKQIDDAIGTLFWNLHPY